MEWSGQDIGSDARSWRDVERANNPLEVEWRRHSQGRAGPVRQRRCRVRPGAVRRRQRLRLSAAGVSHPGGGSWGTPVTISGANETAATVNLVATPAGTFVAGWVNGASVKAAMRAVGHSTFGSPAVVGSGDSLELAVAAGKTAATSFGP